MNNNPTIIPAVSLLLLVGSPAAIARFVIAIVVGIAVNGMLLGWPCTHVVKKCLKRLTPPVAYRHSTTAVSPVFCGVYVFAPSYHVLPCAVFWGTLVSYRVTMLGLQFPFQTSAAGLLSSRQLASLNDFDGSASAGAMPVRYSSLLASEANYRESTKRFAGEVFETTVGRNKMDVRHARTSSTGCVQDWKECDNTSSNPHFTTPKERFQDHLNKTGRVWLVVMGLTQPPMVVSGTKPNIVEAKDGE